MQAVIERAPVGSRTFYATSGNLRLTVRPSTKHVEANTGKLTSLSGKYIQFNSMGGTSDGRYVTDDPEEIAFLEKRIAGGARDVFDEDGYYKYVTPPEKRADNLANALEATRAELDKKNRLIEQLQADNRAKATK